MITTLEENLPESGSGMGSISTGWPLSRAAVEFFAWVHQLNLAMLERGVRLCNGKRYDLVHAHDWLVAYAGRGLKHSFQIPLVASVHATEFGRNNGLHNDEQRYIGEVNGYSPTKPGG